MSFLCDTFQRVLGKPAPSATPGLAFTNPNPEWEVVRQEIGAGWFYNRFLYLFGEGLEALQPCLDAWSFVVPPGHPDRKILGRNGYGAILVLENGNTLNQGSIHLLDPLNVRYWTDPNITLVTLCGNHLPKRRIPKFLDADAYDEWIAANGDVELELEDILGVKVPLSLGGELTVDNLQLDGIVEYYQATGPIYADAFAKLG